MSSQVSTKVRLVRCPKCRQVLAELPDVLLYECGGCGTVLQAKNRKREISTTEQSPQVTESAAKSRQSDVSESTSSLKKDFATRSEVDSLSNNDKVRCRDENGYSEGIHEGRSVISNSPEVPSPQNEDSSTEPNDLSKHDSLSQISKSTFHDDIGESSRGRDFSDELPSSGELTLSLVEQQEGEDFVEKVHNLPEHKYMGSVLSPERENDSHILPENDDTGQICSDDRNRDSHGEIKHLRVNSSSGIVSRGDVSTIKNTNESVGGSRVFSRSPSKESLVSFYHISSDSEYPDHFPTEDSQSHLGRFSSLDISERRLAAPTVTIPESESYYAYCGSESSYDGIDDQIFQRISQASRKNKVSNNRNTEMPRTKNGFHGNNSTAAFEPEWSPTSSSLHTKRNHHRGNQGKLSETSRYATTGNRARLDGLGPMDYRHVSLPPRPPSSGDQDNISLLRTVCELKDQLSRMRFPQARGFSYDRFPLGGEIYSDARRPTGYNLRQCLHCCPQDWRYSVQLPLDNPCRVHTKRYASSEASSWGYETKPDKKRHEDKIIRSKEKYFAAKRQVRPVAGGAPVVICYRCTELLRLPSDFVLFRRKCHRLICHACKEVLRFSLREGRHIVPYIPQSPDSPWFDESVKHLSGICSPQRADRPLSCSNNYYNGNISSGSSYEAVEGRKMKSSFIEPGNKIGESAGPSDNEVGDRGGFEFST